MTSSWGGQSCSHITEESYTTVNNFGASSAAVNPPTLSALTITSSGRAIAWPNIYQHRVQPFRLRDPTRPGHRKILAIFLVDPSINPIPSATTVPPQQADWAFDALEGARGDPHSAFSRLPLELSEMIQTESAGDSLMKRSEAEEYRLALMEERTQSVQAHDVILSYSFNMCEH